MKNEFDYKEVAYNVDLSKTNDCRESMDIPSYDSVLEKIKNLIKIEDRGYNIYLIDDFAKTKLESIKKAVQESLPLGDLKDLCYVIYEDERFPKIIELPSGRGIELQNALEDIKETYKNVISDFYNDGLSEKEKLLDKMQAKKNLIIEKLYNEAKAYDFDIKYSGGTFSFVPLKNGMAMTEKEYEALGFSEKQLMIDRLNQLKHSAHEALDKLKNYELETLQGIKEQMIIYFGNMTNDLKTRYFSSFKDQDKAINYLKYVCQSIEGQMVKIFSLNYEDDEAEINELVDKYKVRMLVNNEKGSLPPVIVEEDPTIFNLMGGMEYENHNGSYKTNIELIKPGSLVKANGGCLIIKANSLFSYANAYHYLKRALEQQCIKFDKNTNYIELISPTRFKPEEINIKTKVILIGDYKTYEILYNMDEEFKDIFKIRIEYDRFIESNPVNIKMIAGNIKYIISKNALVSIEESGMKEIFKYLSRKAGNRRQFSYNDEEIKKILMLASSKAKIKNKSRIKAEDIEEVLYEKEPTQKYIFQGYKENKIVFDVDNSLVGSVNGLSVIDLGYLSFGRPIRITCSCSKGSGEIFDMQKENSLSGNIHSKSINILKGLMNGMFGSYSGMNVDFHISFEQLYGKIEGDSASVAEVIGMISALSKIPVRQNIAITGSINQFGEVQPVGGIIEKIEGFYDVCKLKKSFKNKGVIIPKLNSEELVLRRDIEEEIFKSNFHIYYMTNLKDALEIILEDGALSYEEIISAAVKEQKKYASRGKI